MLYNRQAPGRDFHKHFSLASARSDTNPPSNPQSAPAPSPLQDRAQARNATSRATHLSLIPLTPSAPSRLRSPTPAPFPPSCPPSTFTRRRLERRTRGREGHRWVSSWDSRDTPHFNHNATHPAPPALPSPIYCRTAGRQNPCLCPERCHVWPGGADADICECLVLYGYAFAFSWLPSWLQW